MTVPCAGQTEVMFGPPAAARALCAICEAPGACLRAALAEEWGEDAKRRYGVRAGTSPSRRVVLEGYVRQGQSARLSEVERQAIHEGGP